MLENFKKIFFILLFLHHLIVVGQNNNCDQINIKNYENSYNLGEFEKVDEELRLFLQNCTLSFTLQKDIFRLLSMNSIAMDQMEIAESDIKQLLKIDQNYKLRSDDPFVFKSLLNNLRYSNTKFVTSVSKIAENINEAPANIILVSKEDIKNRGYRDLEEIFHDLPGFDISRTSGPTYSSIYQRGYRTGNNNDRSLILIDGIEDNDIWSNSIWLSRQYALSNIKQFEIIHGPASTMYGANAFGGVYNVITMDPVDMIPSFDENFGFNGFFGYGSYNTKEADFTMAFRKNKLSATVTARFFQSDEFDRSNYDDFDYSYSPNDLSDYLSLQMPYNSSIGSNYYTNLIDEDLNGSIDYVTFNAFGAELAQNLDRVGRLYNEPFNKIGYSNESINKYLQTKILYGNFTLGFSYWSNEEGLAWFNDVYFAGTDNRNKWQPTQTTMYLKYDKNISSKSNITNTTSYKIHELGNNTGLTSIPTSIYQSQDYGLLEFYANTDINYLNNTSNTSLYASDEELLNHPSLPTWNFTRYMLNSDQIRNETKYTYNGEKFKLVSGLEGRYSEIQENYIYTDESEPIIHKQYDLGFYAQGNYTFKKLKFVFGGRLDYNKIDSDGGYGYVFNPRLALVYPYKNWVFKSIYSEAFKDATNFDKFSTAANRIFTNPTLPPEKVKTTEVSILWDNSNNSDGLKIFAEISAFNSNFSGAIQSVETNIDGVVGNQNQDVGELDIIGGQIRSNFMFNSNLSFELNYTYTDPKLKQFDSSTGALGDAVRIGDIATHKGNLILDWKFKKFKNDKGFHFNWNNRLNISDVRPTGSETSVSSNPFNNIDGFAILNSYFSYQSKSGLLFGIGVDNVFDQEWFVPGARSASGIFASRVPQQNRNYFFRIGYDLR